MPSPRIDHRAALAGLLALAYPLLVWFGIGFLPPTAFVLAGVACLALRMAATRRLMRGPVETVALCAAAALLVALLAISPPMAARAYPVAVSLAMASIFAASLRYPPTVVERIARLTEPELPPEGVAYTRQVTRVWAGFLLLNAVISAATALFGTLAQWTLWNGCLSYLAMGTLFGTEILVRRRVRL